MPYSVHKRGSQYCVVKDDNGETMKCYDNKDAANKYNTALNMAHARAKGHIPMDEETIQQLGEVDESQLWEY